MVQKAASKPKAAPKPKFEALETFPVNKRVSIGITRTEIAIVAGATALVLTADELAALETVAHNARERFDALKELPEFAKTPKG